MRTAGRSQGRTVSGLDQLGWRRLGVHNGICVDDFCEFGHELREEVLNFPDWKEMLTISGVDYEAQTGITTGHIIPGQPPELVLCQRFSAFIKEHRRELCALVGADDDGPLGVELNAMAYGQGGWLSRHSDDVVRRRAAWILYLTHPDDGEWTQADGGALRLSDDAGNEALLYPRFNRFAAFRVDDASWHEILEIKRDAPWERMRLALSGWVVNVAEQWDRKSSGRRPKEA